MQFFPASRGARRRLLALALLTLGAAAHARTSTQSDTVAGEEAARRVMPGDHPETFRASVDEFDRIARALADSGAVPAIATVVVKDGKVVSQHAYGVTEAGGGAPVSTKTVFRLASLSKAFAAT